MPIHNCGHQIGLKLVALVWICVGLGCSKTMLEVKYPQMISSAEAYTELSKLTVALDGKLDASLRDKILASLKTCPLFTEVSSMDKPVRVSGSNPKDYFDALIKRSQQAQTAQGLMSIQIENFTENSQLEKSQSLVLTDLPNSDWFATVGLPIAGTMAFAGHPELAPAWSLKRRDTYIRSDKIQYILRFVMYNRVAGKIVHDRVVSNTSSLFNFSRNPSLKKAKFVELVQKSVIDEILFYACPAKQNVTRHIYYQKKPDPNTDQINEGADLVDQNRWNLAATKWNNVLLKDKKNALAHHNLGVHYERSGDFFQALEHFKQVRHGSFAKIIPENVYDEIRKDYQPHQAGAALYPQVSFVTGGNWAFVRSDDLELTDVRPYSLYRLEPTVNTETSRATGLTVREVGVFKMTAQVDDLYSGRIKEFLIDYPVRPGDFLIAE